MRILLLFIFALFVSCVHEDDFTDATPCRSGAPTVYGVVCTTSGKWVCKGECSEEICNGGGGVAYWLCE